MIFEVGDVVRRVYGHSGGMKVGDTATVKEILNNSWMSLVGYEERHLMERFELVERKEKTMEDRVKELNKAFNKIALKDNERNLERAKKEEQEYLRDIKRYKEYMDVAWNSYKNAMNRVKVLSSENEGRDYTSDMEAILSHKYVVSAVARSTSKVVEITTDYIDIYDEKGNKFKGNKYLLSFDFDDMTCYINGLDEDYNRKSYWTDKDPHPHVNGENGEACWGSAGSMLVDNMNNYEIYASFIVVLNFLQQVNTDDAAGAYIRNWDCIDEGGNDLENPYDKEYNVCCICDEELDEDSAFYCEDCGDHMCDDHAYWIDNNSMYVCERCYENDYSRCDNCDENTHNNDMTWYGNNVYCDDCYCELIATCHECGEECRKDEMSLIDNEWHCDDCYSDLIETCCECGEECRKDEMNFTNDKWYCEDCYEELFVDCAECGDAVRKEDTFQCKECGYTYCTDCQEEKEGMCEDCYEEELEEREEL